MRNTHHTPGPLKIVNHSWRDTSIVDNTGEVVCLLSVHEKISEYDLADEKAKQAANAHLLRSAPELKEALKFACKYILQDPETIRWISREMTEMGERCGQHQADKIVCDTLQAAIAKAEGR